MEMELGPMDAARLTNVQEILTIALTKPLVPTQTVDFLVNVKLDLPEMDINAQVSL